MCMRLREDEQAGAVHCCGCRRQSNTKAQWTPSFEWRILVPVLVKRRRSLVTVVDDDESMRESLPDLLLEFGDAARVKVDHAAF
jgi:hypothetical protein